MADYNAVGLLWEEGEEQASNGDLHGALLSFQRAKAALVNSNNGNNSSTNNSDAK
jgi:DNA-binding SARP family transcriptional activator